MDLDPDPNRRFSPVRIPKRFCRRIDLVRKDATVTAIGRGGGGAHSYFKSNGTSTGYLGYFCSGSPGGARKKKPAPPPLETDLGSRFPSPWKTSPFSVSCFQGAPSQGRGAKKRSCHRRPQIEGYSTLERSVGRFEFCSTCADSADSKSAL